MSCESQQIVLAYPPNDARMDAPPVRLSGFTWWWRDRNQFSACGHIHTCKGGETNTELVSYAMVQIKMNVIISIKMKSIFENDETTQAETSY